MSGEPKTEGKTPFKRVPVIVRSWDGPNSRIGLEMDLDQMPWGPFDALGKRLGILLPDIDESATEAPASESQVERALRHVEHAADRCAEFAQLANGDQELWLRSQETWEWVRRYLTGLWVETEVEGRNLLDTHVEAVLAPPDQEKLSGTQTDEPDDPGVPVLPGAASTLRAAAKALRATPLAAWRETMGPPDPDAPTREEAVQTLLGVARILGGQGQGEPTEAEDLVDSSPAPMSEPTPSPEAEPDSEPTDPDQVSFDYAKGYDEGYQMGRRVGYALGGRSDPRQSPRKD